VRALSVPLVGFLILSFVVVGSASGLAAGQSRVAASPASLSNFGTTVSSSNWAGYAVEAGSKFTKVSGSWVEPSVVGSCPTTARYASIWVGIDGYASKTVEQLGTDADCSGGSAVYYAWYEMYPAASVNIATLTIHPGDHISASVTVSGAQFTLKMSDTTTRGTFSIHKTGSGLAQSSAEWIVEAPEICTPGCTLTHLNDFGKVRFTAAEATTGGTLSPVSAFTTGGGPFQITMTNGAGTKVHALPSALGTTGETFTVTWKSA
jgi:hypothetical protein